MSSVKKGYLTTPLEWAKHLRPWGRRQFWGKHRKAEKQEGEEQLQEMDITVDVTHIPVDVTE